MGNSIGPKIGIEGENEFRKAITHIRQEFRLLDSEMKLVASQFGKNEKSMDSYRAKNTALEGAIEKQKNQVGILTTHLDTQKTKLEELKKVLEETSKSHKEDSKEVVKAQNEYRRQVENVNRLETELNKTTAALNENERELKNNKKALKEAALETEEFKKKTQEMGNQLKTVGDGFKGVGNTLTKYITMPVVAATGAVAGMVTAFGWGRLKAIDTAQAQLKGLGYELEEVKRISGQVSEAVRGTTVTMAEGTSIAAGGLAAGVKEGEELVRYIKLVGDAAVGANRPVEDMATIFNRVQGSGKLMTRELNMIEQSMPGFAQAMADSLGVTQEEFRKMVTTGKITSKRFLDVMEDFAGEMSEAYANSWEGMIANTKSNIGIIGENLLGGVFKKSKESIKEFLDLLRSDSIRGWAQETGQLLGETFSKILDTIKGMLRWFTNLGSDTQKLIGKVVIFVAALGPLLSIFGSIVSTIASFTLALPTLGLAMTALTGPVGMTVTVVGLLVGILGSATLASQLVGDEVSTLTQTVKKDTEAWKALQEQQEKHLETNLAEIDRTRELWEELQTLIDTNGKVVGSKERVKFISEEINKLAPESIKWLDDETIAYGESAKAIDDLIEKKRAQVILESQEAAYREALLKVGDKQAEQARFAIDLMEQEKRAQEARDEAVEKGGLINVLAAKNQESILHNMQEEYSKNQNILRDYYATIQGYEENSAAITSGNYEKIKEINNNIVMSYKTATDGTVEQLKKQAYEAQFNAEMMQDEYNKGTKGITEDMVRNAKETAKQALEEYKKVGEDIVAGAKKGVESKQGGFIQTVKNMAKAAIAAAKAADALDSNSPSKAFMKIGRDVGEGLAIGIKESKAVVAKASRHISNILISEEEKIQKQLAELDKEFIERREKESEKAHKEALEKKYAELAKADKKGKQKVLGEIAKLQADREKQLADESEKTLRDSLNNQLKIVQGFKKEYEKAIEEIEKAQENMSSKLIEFGGLFERTQNALGREIFKLTDLQDQINEINRYGEALEDLKKRGISDSLLDEIKGMSVKDAIDYSNKLLNLTDEKYKEYMSLWEEKQRIAKSIATNYYKGEIASLKEEFVDKIPTELSHIKDEMQEVGANAGRGLAVGFKAQSEYIKRTFTSVLEDALSAARSSMEIRSPSRKWAEVGSFMAQGLGVGFKEQMRDVTRQINDSIPTSVSPTAKIGEGIVNGLAGIIPQQAEPYHINIVLQNGKALAEAVFDPLTGIAKQKGVPVIG